MQISWLSLIPNWESKRIYAASHDWQNSSRAEVKALQQDGNKPIRSLHRKAMHWAAKRAASNSKETFSE